MKVFVIGGGPAGIMAAISAANCGHSVHLFEKNEKLGKNIPQNSKICQSFFSPPHIPASLASFA